MADSFDPYLKWLGIAPEEQPPNHYRLLGVPLFIDDPDVIENAADRQMTHVRSFQSGKRAGLSQKLLNEISAAKVCLLNASTREAYDKQLKAKLSADRPASAIPSKRLKVAKPATARPAARSPSDRFDVDVGPTAHRAIVRSRKPVWRSPAVLGASACVVLLLIGGIIWLSLPGKTDEVSELPAAPPNFAATNDSPETESDTNTSRPPEDEAALKDVQVAPVEISPPDNPANSNDINSASPLDEPQTAVATPNADPVAPDDTAKPNHIDDTTTAAPKLVYLDDLQETEYRLHDGIVLAKHGASRQKWPVEQPTHSLVTHPPSSSFAYVDYTLTEPFGKFAVTVTVLTIDQMRGEVAFEVIGDDVSLWRSQPFRRDTDEPFQPCSVDIRGVQKLRLKVDCPGTAFGAWAAWIEPRLMPVEDPREVAASKLPVPDAATQKRLHEEIRDLFDKEIAAARTPEEILELAKFFLEQARQTTDDADATYVMLDLARRAAAGVGDAEVALAAVAAMAERYGVEPWEQRTTTLTTVGKSTRGAGFKERALKLAKAAQALVDEAIRDGQYRAAEAMLDIALEAAKKVDDIALRKAIVNRADEVELLARQYREFEAALGKLASDNDDPEANLVVGRFLCFVQGDWQRGLPLLAKSGSDGLRQIAQLEIAVPAAVEDQIAVGDAWWDLADATSDRNERDPLQRRAVHWYRQALPQLSGGLQQAKIQQRISEAAASATVDDGARRSTDRPTVTRVNLLGLIDPAKNVVRGNWSSERGVLMVRPSGYATIEIPYEVKGDYDLKLVGKYLDRNPSLAIGLVLGQGRSGMVNFHGGGLSGLEMIDGRGVKDNETTVEGKIIPADRPFTVTCQIRQDHVVVTLDQKTIIDWKGSFDRCSVYPDWTGAQAGRLFIGSYNGGFAFNTIELASPSAAAVTKIDSREEKVQNKRPIPGDLKFLFIMSDDELKTAKEACRRYGYPYETADSFDASRRDYRGIHTIISGSNAMDYWAADELKLDAAFQHIDAFVRAGGHLIVTGSFNGRNNEHLKRYGITTGYSHSDSFEPTDATAVFFRGNERIVPPDRKMKSAGNFKCSEPHTVLLARGQGSAEGDPAVITLRVGKGRVTFTLCEPEWQNDLWLIDVLIHWTLRGAPIE